MAVAFVLGALSIAQASRHLRMQNSFEAETIVRAQMDDVESEMSALLAKSGVIREDIYNKPGDQYTLHVQSGPFVQIPLLHGTFRFAGAYAGAYGGLWAGGLGLRGGLPGGLAGMFAGVPMGMHAGEKAAETISRLAQGQGSIVYKPEQNSFVQKDMKVIHAKPKADKTDQGVEDLKNVVLAIGGQKVTQKEVDVQSVLHGLSAMLDSQDQNTREDAIMTILMLEILRRNLHHNVIVIVQ